MSSTKKRSAALSHAASSAAKRLCCSADEAKTDQVFHARVQRLYTPADNLERQITERLFAPREWTLDEKHRVFRTQDSNAGPPLEVAESVVQRLRTVLHLPTAEASPHPKAATLIVHLSQWVLDRETQLYQFVDERAQAHVLTAEQLRRVYGDQATADHAKLVRDARRPAPAPVEHKAPAFPPLASVDGVGKRHRELYREVVSLIESVRSGHEPVASRKLHALAKTSPSFQSDLLHLQQTERVLAVEDVDMVLQSIDQHHIDDHAVAVLSAIPDDERPAPDGFLVPDDDYDADPKPSKTKAKSKPKQAAASPMTATEKKKLSRKLFGTLATMRREAAANGYQLARIPCTLIKCRRCSKMRVVDDRCSSSVRAKFACGGDIQISQEVGCGAADEVLKKSTAFVFQEPLKRLVFA